MEIKMGSNLHNLQINAPRMETTLNISISSGMDIRCRLRENKG